MISQPSHIDTTNGEIIVYRPDDTTSVEVRMDSETVWLTQEQISSLFQKERSGITKHIGNIFKEGELDEKSNVTFFHIANSDKPVKFFSLDVIISVGYRVKSLRGTQFRIWANGILKQHLLRGYTINQQIVQLEQRIEKKLLQQHDDIRDIKEIQQRQQHQIDFFIKTNTPPAEMVFFNGEFFTARVALEQLIKAAKQRVIIIDPYVDAKTFDMMDVRSDGVTATIYTVGVGAGMTRLRDEHNRQAGVQPVEIYKWANESHDRWLIIDDKLYHCGHSLNAIGNKMSAITLMGISPETVLSQM